MAARSWRRARSATAYRRRRALAAVRPPTGTAAYPACPAAHPRREYRGLRSARGPSCPARPRMDRPRATGARPPMPPAKDPPDDAGHARHAADQLQPAGLRYPSGRDVRRRRADHYPACAGHPQTMRAVCVDGNALEAPFRRVPDTLALAQSRLLRDLAEDPEQIATQKFPDALIGIPSTQHCVRNHREIADVAHPARQRRPAIEIAAERDVVLADQPYGAVDHAHPLAHGHADFIGDP